MNTLHIVCAGEGPNIEFVEVENSSGKSVNVGEWRKRGDGYHELVLPWDGHDWIKEAAQATRVLLQCEGLRDKATFINAIGVDVQHAIGMCEKIESGEISGRKAHRWLGWLQCVAVVYGSATLDDCKRINKAASEQLEKKV